ARPRMCNLLPPLLNHAFKPTIKARLPHPSTPDNPEHRIEGRNATPPLAEHELRADHKHVPSRTETTEKKMISERGRRLSLRLFALLVALLPISLLVIARNLSPSQQGLGTHQQLGLPPCSMRVMFGIRCPGCGMTTSWSHFTRGQFTQSMQANFGGFLLACLALLVPWIAIRTVRTGQWPSLRSQQWLTYLLIAIVVVTLLEWLGRLST
ncbi:MAG: DUF2752 domain-containing protein, partial [Rubripirellula sp.]